LQNLKILNKKEISRILSKIKEQFDIDILTFEYGMLQNKEGKLFLISKDINKVNLDKLRINELGLYFANINKEVRLTIEGSQLIGKFAKKNIYEVNEEDAYSWMSGNDLICKEEFNGFVIIKNKDNYLGTGKFKDNRILNYTPKERWIKRKDYSEV